MSNNNSGNVPGKQHAPGVMCVVVGQKTPGMSDNNGKVVTLEMLVRPGTRKLCSCSPDVPWNIFDQLNFGDCWRVRGDGLQCSQAGDTPYTTIPQRNLLPIGDGQLSLEMLAELSRQRSEELAIRSLAALASRATLF